MIALFPLGAGVFNLYMYLDHGHHTLNIVLAVSLIAYGLVVAMVQR